MKQDIQLTKKSFFLQHLFIFTNCQKLLILYSKIHLLKIKFDFKKLFVGKCCICAYNVFSMHLSESYNSILQVCLLTKISCLANIEFTKVLLNYLEMKKNSIPKAKIPVTNVQKKPLNNPQTPKEAPKNIPFTPKSQKKEIAMKPATKGKPSVPKFQVKEVIPLPKPLEKPIINNQPLIQAKPASIPDPLSLLKPKDSSKQVAAVIVSFHARNSYDHLFRSVEQKSLEGTQVLVYAGEGHSVKDIYNGMREQPTTDTVKQLLENIKGVDPDCVVFNWECSCGYSTCRFPEDAKIVMSFLQLILNAGHMAMFSDFSLKALINQWDQNLLGKNPFVKTGRTSGMITLKFNPGLLKECPSAQLQIVGDMAIGGQCQIQTLGQTIIYSVNPEKIDHQKYKLDVLTINTTNKPTEKEFILQIDEQLGSAGHVLLTYKSGGMILASMGHWIELMKVDTNEQKIFQLAKEEFGAEVAEKMKAEYKLMNAVAKKKYIETQSIKYVQSQAPCSNMSKKAKKMKM